MFENIRYIFHISIHIFAYAYMMCKYVRDHDFSPWTSPFCPPTSKVLGEPYAVRLMTCQLSQLTSSPYFGETRPTVLFFWNQRPQVWKSSYPGVSVVGRAQEGYLQGEQVEKFGCVLPAVTRILPFLIQMGCLLTRGSMSWKHLPFS